MHMSQQQDQSVSGEYVELDGESYYKIGNSHQMPSFFMSIVGASDHWMFVSSQGALTAGRQNPDVALFPYQSDDQLAFAQRHTGPLTLIRCLDQGGQSIWEPLTPESLRQDRGYRNIYKSPQGNKLVFEEVNEARQLAFRYRWTFSEKFGFVRSCRLTNIGPTDQQLTLLDGIQNILPFGVGSDFFQRFSNLANAYKKCELIDETDIGIYYFSSIPTDKAEPSEGLKATTVWQSGLPRKNVLLSSDQVDRFRRHLPLTTERDIRGRAGAYLVESHIALSSGESVEWSLVADVGQDHSAVVGLDDWLKNSPNLVADLEADVANNERRLLEIVSSSDGIQLTANPMRCNRHLSNTTFNVMRGGIPLDGYQFPSSDFVRHVRNSNRRVHEQHADLLSGLPERLTLNQLKSAVAHVEDDHLQRLVSDYLPLTFSRRHGDPTRPWNRFSIDVRDDQGEPVLNYQGNWRDIFQNWEALGLSFPEFFSSMITRFVNATTADGYNPYRVTRDGFEWEAPTPGDPWANIGYWGDHQIIYLLKLLEWSRNFYPLELDQYLTASCFTHADVPYRIKPFEQMRKDCRETIDYDWEAAKRIEERVAEIGGDGKLVHDVSGNIACCTMLEKFVILTLAKVSNLVPDGGIWLNTQRPEWNDANNALVGNGLSVVTSCYLYRWLDFLHQWVGQRDDSTFTLSTEVADFFEAINAALSEHLDRSLAGLDATSRLEVVTAFSEAASEYRANLYDVGFSGDKTQLERQRLLDFLGVARRMVEHTIRVNQRLDGLFHAYNLIDWQYTGVDVEHLYEMLEGQVAVLSSGLLTAKESVELLDVLRSSLLYCEERRSYQLYPNRRLPRFLEKNCISKQFVASNRLVQKLLGDDDGTVVKRDVRGDVHFVGDLRNSKELLESLQRLGPEYDGYVKHDAYEMTQMFDQIFGHRQFTGRSGTFFAYEGLGSIYWHMVSKLGLAVSETIFRVEQDGADPTVVDQLRSHYREIYMGIGAEKHPLNYGAFPTDPYSHTPENAGVKQPGMTGQVKEDILARFAELGVVLRDGCLGFRLGLLDAAELCPQDQAFEFIDIHGNLRNVAVPRQGIGYTLFQVPIVYRPGATNKVSVRLANGSTQEFDGQFIDKDTSRMLFSRSGDVQEIQCEFVDLSSS